LTQVTGLPASTLTVLDRREARDAHVGPGPRDDGGGAARGAQRGQRDDEVLLLVRL